MNLQPILFSNSLKNNFKFGNQNHSGQPGKQIKLPGDIKITICGVKGDKVKLGIEAPDGTSVKKEDEQPHKKWNPFPPSSNN